MYYLCLQYIYYIRYCAKLPSDTFTKLSPIWKIQSVIYENKPMFVCSIRLPINSPIKHDIHVSINVLFSYWRELAWLLVFEKVLKAC